MSDSGPRPYHHGDLREQLLNAGEEALAQLPAEKVTLREIARRAGVSHAAPKHHFPTLGHLFAEICARGFQRFVAELAAAADASADQGPEARLMAMGRAYLHFAGANPAAYHLMFVQSVNLLRTPHMVEASYAAWTQLVEAVTAVTGSPRALAGALHVWSSVHGLAMLRAAGRVPPDLPWESLGEMKLRMMMQGLKAE